MGPVGVHRPVSVDQCSHKSKNPQVFKIKSMRYSEQVQNDDRQTRLGELMYQCGMESSKIT